MSEMRELARLYMIFMIQDGVDSKATIEDMFTRTYKDALFGAIEYIIDKPDGDEKHGLKLHLNAILLRSINAG